VAENRQRRRDAEEPGEQQHRHRHQQSSDKSGHGAGGDCAQPGHGGSLSNKMAPGNTIWRPPALGCSRHFLAEPGSSGLRAGPGSDPLAWALHRDAKESGDDAGPGHESSSERSRHFRFATSAAAMIHWQFQNPQPRPGGPHLHFEIPTVGRLSHSKTFEGITPDRPERAHVGIADAVEKPKKKAGNSPGKNLLEIHAARFAIPSGARPDHKILFAPNDRLD